MYYYIFIYLYSAKCTINTFRMLQKNSKTFYYSKNHEEYALQFSQKILCGTTIFNTDNIFFLSTKAAYQNDF